MNTHIVRGLDQDGNEFFYTGRAGLGWVSTDLHEGFHYTLDGARRKALQFNANTELHGLRFVASSPFPVVDMDAPELSCMGCGGIGHNDAICHVAVSPRGSDFRVSTTRPGIGPELKTGSVSPEPQTVNN